MNLTGSIGFISTIVANDRRRIVSVDGMSRDTPLNRYGSSIVAVGGTSGVYTERLGDVDVTI